MTIPSLRSKTSAVLRLNLDTGHVQREGEVRVLTPKTLAVLSFLIERPQQIVSKETLLATVWEGTTVSPGVLKTCLWELRQALGDHPQTPSFIGTLPRRGYWFIGSIQRTMDASTILLRPAHAASPTSSFEGRQRPQLLMPVHSVSPRSVSPRVALFGREVVLTQLRSLVAQAKAGKPQVVFVTGEVGMGKTAVIEAFLQEVGSVSSVWIARGQCVDQHAEREAYFPVLDALGQLGRSAERMHVVSVLKKYAPTWLAQLPALVHQTAHEKLQQGLVKGTQGRMLREFIDAVGAFTDDAIARVASVLILVLEDLHWSDDATLDLLAALARHRGHNRALRVFVVGSYRPAELRLRDSSLQLPRGIQDHGGYTELALEKLTEKAVAEYLAKRLESEQIPPQLVHLIHHQTGGNPFFMTEFVEQLLAKGDLLAQEQRWILAPSIEHCGVPTSIRQVVEKQLSQNSEAERQLLTVASIIGLEFSAAAVAALLDRQTDEVEACCHQLVQRHFFLDASDPDLLLDRRRAARYVFSHPFARAVLYTKVPTSKRIQLHRQIGLWLEGDYGEQVQAHAPELAEHFERGHDYERAVRYRHYTPTFAGKSQARLRRAK
jgi:predicted ATPase/DNA-binding winged helix-turn-helix (wHTH) protein